MIPREIKLDFQDSKYISVNAKQFDKSGRYINIVMQNKGKSIRIDAAKYYAFVRYRRVDGLGIIRSCKITTDGKIQFRLDSDMLEHDGKNYADIVLIETDTPRKPIAENGFFVVDYVYNEDEKILELFFSPSPDVEHNENTLTMETIKFDNKTIQICEDPAPFVAHDGVGTLTFATIDENGEITMQNPSIVSTMSFCVNVIRAAFYDNCVEIMR